MKVSIDLTPAVKQNAGIGRYAEELARALVALDAGLELQAFYVDDQGREPRKPLDVLPRVAIHENARWWRARIAVATRLGPSFDRYVGRADLFHATDHVLPPLRKTRSVLTLYDLTYLHYPWTQTIGNRTYIRTMLPVFARRADALIAISESTKRDAMAAWGVVADRTHVIPLAANPIFHPLDRASIDPVLARHGLPDRYVLFVGTIEPRKNLELLYRTWSRLRSKVPLVVAGRRGWLYEDSFRELARQGVAERVRFLGGVTDADLPALYGGAQVFVFPSWYEGFGLPLLEAMACGTPVVASDGSSHPEVVGNAGILLSPEDPGKWVEVLEELLESSGRRREMREAGIARAARFSWERVARETLAVYRGICDGRS